MKKTLIVILLAGVTMTNQSAFTQPPAMPATGQASTPTPGTTPKPAAPAVVPKIPDADRAEFFKQQLRLEKAQQDFQNAQMQYQTAVKAITQDCGESYIPSIDQAGDPVCTAKPEQPKAQASPAAPVKKP